MKWTSVNDRLPEPIKSGEDPVKYLVYVDYPPFGETMTADWYGDREAGSDCFWIEGVGWADYGLTHWMPLPEPPKDGEL